ncbi:MAG: hypothetical protein HUU32_18280 [Calditrichaceae bacterium]|nr:hypothetical protein [Calditrichia bacterium]NUQ43342.1 hypothetical protein [Calditrichaceae bacterium]
MGYRSKMAGTAVWLRLIFFVALLRSPLMYAGDYTHVDQYVLNLSRAGEEDLLKLTHTLVSPFKADSEKVRAVYRWIAANIEYDIQAYQERRPVSSKPEDVLKKRRSVCGGYAALFKEMISLAGLEAEIVTGYSKGYGYEFGSVFAEHNLHAWNAVRIADRWRLLDPTWGAGHIDENSRFVRSFNDYYFLTPPEELILTHYPHETRWQLLDPKKTKKEFEEFVYLRPAFFKYGMKIISHPTLRITAQDSLKVILAASRSARFVSRLQYGENTLDGMLTFTQRKGDSVEVYAVFPLAASYTLRLFANDSRESAKYEWALDYQVDAKVSHAATVGFPEKYLSFDVYNAYLYAPFNRFLNPGSAVYFKMSIPKAEEAALIFEDTFTFLKKNGHYFEGEPVIPEGEFYLGAKLPGSNYYHYLLKYDGWKQGQ